MTRPGPAEIAVAMVSAALSGADGEEARLLMAAAVEPAHGLDVIRVHQEITRALLWIARDAIAELPDGEAWLRRWALDVALQQGSEGP